MARQLTDLYQQPYCVRCLAAALEKVAGKPWKTVLDEASYRAQVSDRAWEALPAPIRAFGRDRLGWDRFCLELRREIFDVKGEKVIVRPDLKARMNTLAVRLFDTQEIAAETILKRKPTAPPASPAGASPPLAQPVRPAVPIAPRVEPAEPAEPALPDSGVAIGIDLGTTYSVVAYIDPHGRPCTITNAAGDLLTPSIVLFEEAGVVVGKEAAQAALMEPEKIADVFKRDMGSKAYRKKINGEFLPPEVISSFILKGLKADAERRLGGVRRAVITVPAYFDEARRRATMDAGKLAGLEVLDIINEPTAAALAYGYQLGFLDTKAKAEDAKPLKVLVFDLGGGTFDVTIMEIRGRAFRALATDGDVCLGGKDWDEKLIDIAAEAFRKQHREDPRDNPISLQELWQAAEVAKKTLTERPRAALFVNHLGARLKVEVTREEFEQAAAPLLGRTRTTTEIVLRQSGLAWADIDRVLLVGGSTRMPAVAAMLQELTGKPPERSVSPDEAVAHGAALYADLLMQQRGRAKSAPAAAPRFAVTNVNSHALGIVGVDRATGRKRNHILIPKNTPLPTTVTKPFKTTKPKQRSVVIRVVEGESERPEACIQLGTCAIKDLPADLPAGWPGEVSYTYEANGRLHVNAKVKGHAAAVTTDFQRDNSLEDEDLRLWARFVAEESGRLG